MTQTLAERITGAKGNARMRDADLESLIADAKAERERLVGSAASHDEESTDFALSDDDREEASRLAGSFQRAATGLAKEIAALESQLEEKQNSDKRKAEEATRAAIVARRDALAARLKERMPALLDELIGLLDEIELNDLEIEPLRLESAEAIARGVPGNFYDGPSPIGRYVKMKIPAWGGGRLRWPIDRVAEAMARRQVEEQRRLVERKAAEAAEEARWSRYIITPPDGDNVPTIKTHRGTEQVRSTIERRLTAELVDAARKAGCTVTELKPSERFGLPNAVEIIA